MIREAENISVTRMYGEVHHRVPVLTVPVL